MTEGVTVGTTGIDFMIEGTTGTDSVTEGTTGGTMDADSPGIGGNIARTKGIEIMDGARVLEGNKEMGCG